MIFVGIDVHVRNSYLHILDESGGVLKHGRVDNTLGGFAQFLGPYESQPMVASLESTTNSRAIHRLLEHYGREAGVDLTARVLDARKLRVIAESVTKCDRLDAAVLAELTASNLKLPACYIADDEVFALREHLRARADLVRVRTMVKNRIHAALHRRGVLRPAGGLFGKKGRAWLEQVELNAEGRAIVDRFIELLERIEEQVKASNRDLHRLAERARWKSKLAFLVSMPGVGWITGLTVLGELGDLSRFHSRASVSNYAGLTPRVRNSNESRRLGHISRRGSALLRATIVESAWVAIRYVPRYTAMYEAIKRRGGPGVGIVAVARRMLEDLWTMLVKGQEFRHCPESSKDRGPSSDPTVAPGVVG